MMASSSARRNLESCACPPVLAFSDWAAAGRGILGGLDYFGRRGGETELIGSTARA